VYLYQVSQTHRDQATEREYKVVATLDHRNQTLALWTIDRARPDAYDCSICLDSIPASDNAAWFRRCTLHRMHYHCMVGLLRNAAHRSRCPVCRRVERIIVVRFERNEVPVSRAKALEHMEEWQ
jgi:hypothetical protein